VKKNGGIAAIAFAAAASIACCTRAGNPGAAAAGATVVPGAEAGPVKEYADGLQRIRAGAAEAGRELSGFEPALQIQLVLGRDRGSALDAVMKVPATAAMSLLLPGAVWRKHGMEHPLGEDFEGFADFVPEEVTPAQIDAARRAATPELIGDGVVAGSVDEVVAEIRQLVDVGLQHVVIWNIGPLATGASLRGLLQLAALIRRLRRLALGPEKDFTTEARRHGDQ